MPKVLTVWVICCKYDSETSCIKIGSSYQKFQIELSCNTFLHLYIKKNEQHDINQILFHTYLNNCTGCGYIAITYTSFIRTYERTLFMRIFTQIRTIKNAVVN